MYMSVLILNREQVKQVISMKEVIQEVREVYRLKSQGKSVIWPLVNYEFVDEHAAMDIRSGYIKGVQLHGLKMLNNFPENREKGLPPFNGIMMVYDSNTGIPVSVMDASYVTCMRTGAAGALGVDLLARKDAKHLFILGAGKQAPFQIAATLLLRPAIDKVYIADPMFPDNAVQFAATLPSSSPMTSASTPPAWSSCRRWIWPPPWATVTPSSPSRPPASPSSRRRG